MMTKALMTLNISKFILQASAFMDKKYSILFVYLQKGKHLTGASNMLYNLTNKLSRKYNISILLNSNSVLLDKLKKEKSIHLYTIDLINVIETVLYIPRLISIVIKIIRRDEIKAIWIPNIQHFYFLVWVKFAKVRLISNHFLTKTHILYKLLYTIEYFLSDAMVYEYTNQPQSILLFKKLKYSKKNWIIYSGHDFSKFPAPKLNIREERALKLGTAAQIVRRKGILEIVEAIEYLYKNGKEIQFIIIGDIPNKKHKRYLQEIMKKVLINKIEHVVHIIGWIEHPYLFNELAKINIFISMSYSEGLSGSLREAAALGIPIIATNVGGAADIVINGYNGVLIHPGDSSALIRAILQIDNNYNKFAKNAFEYSNIIRDKFSIANYEEGYVKLIDNISSL